MNIISSFVINMSSTWIISESLDDEFTIQTHFMLILCMLIKIVSQVKLLTCYKKNQCMYYNFVFIVYFTISV